VSTETTPVERAARAVGYVTGWSKGGSVDIAHAALAAAPELNELAEVLFRADCSQADPEMDIGAEWRTILADEGDTSPWHDQARAAIEYLARRPS
jgi:hypothetical protein